MKRITLAVLSLAMVIGLTVPAMAVEVLTAGDIAAGAGKGNDTDTVTAQQILAIDPFQVITLGDNAYPDGVTADFTSFYTPDWGVSAIKSITKPGYGNHDCEDVTGKSGCDDAITYFGGDSTHGTNMPIRGSYWYKVETGATDWLVIVLNSAGEAASGADSGKATTSEINQQNTALQSVLASEGGATVCEAIVFHHPVYTPGTHTPFTEAKPWLQSFYNAGGDLVLNGHEHFYARSKRWNANGVVDNTNGFRQFIVGTGGASMDETPSLPSNYAFVKGDPDSDSVNEGMGVLDLELNATNFTFNFREATGGTGTSVDNGSQTCI